MNREQKRLPSAWSEMNPAEAGLGTPAGSTATHPHIPATAPSLGKQGRQALKSDCGNLVKWVYTNNPFYLVSACFFLYSQTVLFKTDDPWIDTAIPFVLLLGYTALLAWTAVAIVRWGQVWADARSILLILLCLLLVLSVTLDTKILEDLNLSVPMLTGCWVYAICLSAVVLRGLRIRLPLAFRGVYYGLLGLFFYYPYLVARLATFASPDATIRAIGLFPAVVGAGYLFLMPAVRRKPEHVEDNGTPWHWPMFPWLVFALIAVAACLRTYLLAISFFPGEGFGSYRTMTTGVGVYMLIPLFAVIATLAIEHGVTLRDSRVSMGALLSPLVFVAMAAGSEFGRTALETRFTDALLGPNGSALTVAVVCSLTVTGYAWLRGVRLAPLAFVGVAFASVVLDTRSGCLQSVGVSPLMISVSAAAGLAWIAFRRKTSVWAFAALGCVVGGLIWQFHGPRFTIAYGAIPLHMLLVGGTIIAAIFDDMLAQFVTSVIALLLPALFFAAIFFSGYVAPGLPTGVLPAYLLFVVVLAAHGFFYLDSDFHLYAGVLCIAMVGVDMYARFHVLLEQLEVPAVPFLTSAAASFVLAFMISMAKGDVLTRASRTTLGYLIGLRERVHGI